MNRPAENNGGAAALYKTAKRFYQQFYNLIYYEIFITYISRYSMMIPTYEECFAMMEKYGMLENIQAHSVMVEKVARIIGVGIREAGDSISLKKITAGALMHDIGKTPCLNSEQNHAELGGKICVRNHFEEIAGIVEEHIRLKNFEPDHPVSEKEIIYYADKRVNHDEIVSIEERLDYLLERYARDRDDLKELIRLNFDQCREVERKIFSRLDFHPADLARMLE